MILKLSENYYLLWLVIFLIVLFRYFSNFIRICYYVSKIPGPRAFPIIGNVLLLFGSHSDIADTLFSLSKKYSPIFRFWLGPVPAVIILDPTWIQKLLNSHHGLEKSWLMRTSALPFIGESILVSRVSKWKYHRSLIVRGFSPSILKSYFKIFLAKISILAEKLDQEVNGNEPFDIFKYLSKTTMDSICGSTMGANVNAHNRRASYYDAVQSGLYLSYERGFRPWKYPDFIYKLLPEFRQMKECRKVVSEFARQIINEKRHQKNGNEKQKLATDKNIFQKPLLDYLIDIPNMTTKFSDDDLLDEINLIILAGYETTANALSYILLNLAAYKSIQQKVFDELIAVLGDTNRSIDLNDLPKLKYMDMVIKESLRMFTTVPLILRELTEDIQMGKYLIPKGCTCMIPIFSVHRDEKLWQNPMKFDPERFTPENTKQRHPYSYLPFSGGPRNCIGDRYAWMFMKTVLATLLRRYEFHTDLNLNQLQFEIELSLKLVGGYQLRITHRNKI